MLDDVKTLDVGMLGGRNFGLQLRTVADLFGDLLRRPGWMAEHGQRHQTVLHSAGAQCSGLFGVFFFGCCCPTRTSKLNLSSHKKTQAALEKRLTVCCFLGVVGSVGEKSTT